MNRPQVMLVLCMVCIAAGSLFFAYHHLRSRRDHASKLAMELMESRNIATRLVALRDLPDRVGAASLKLTELTQRVERYATDSNINPAEQLLDINPQRPRRVGDLPYFQQDTRLELQATPLPALLRFLHELTAQTPGLSLTSLRLQAPRDQIVGEFWDVELTLTHLIYAHETSLP